MSPRYTTIALLVAAVMALTLGMQIAFPIDADAHHRQAGESKALSNYRDRVHIGRCTAFLYRGLSPSRTVCRAILQAVHTQGGTRGYTASRRWVSDPSLLKLVRSESGYALRAVNPSSGACGLGQMLPCDKFGAGSCWPGLWKQAACLVRYTLNRYRTPKRAWQFWLCPDRTHNRCTPHWY